MEPKISKNQQAYKLSFIILSLLYLIALSMNLNNVIFYMKPLLLLPLMMLVLETKSFKGKILLFLALIFSWFGDILLLFAGDNSKYFILGLLSFLTAHIFYISLFRLLKTYQDKGDKNILVYVFVCLYGITLLFVLFPHLGEMKIPVIIYAVVICVMLITAVFTARRFEAKNSWVLTGGAIAFVLSDSMLAINKFSTPFLGASFLIMLSYLYAQYSITMACLDEVTR